MVALAALLGGAAWYLLAPRHQGHRDARFYTLGELASDLASDKQVWEAVLEKLGAGRTSFGILPSAEAVVLRQLFANADFAALDRHPRVSLEELRGAAKLLGQRRETSAKAADAAKPDPRDGGSPGEIAREPLGIPSKEAAPSGEPYLASIGFGLLHGDRLDPQKGKRARDSERLAAVLDRLALDGAAGRYQVELEGAAIASPEALGSALAKSGHSVEVIDERYAANFGDLERNGLAVATPLWVRTGLLGQDDDELAVPVPHIQVTLVVRGPTVNGDASLYNSLDLAGGSDGGTRFRAEVTGNQPWVGGRIAHHYQGAQAIEALRLMGKLRRIHDEKVRAHHVVLDGYFTLGVCTLAPALVEQAIFGKTTIWPLTQDRSFFTGDDEIDRLVRALPVDLDGAPPDAARILASLPWSKLAEVPFPSLRPQLERAGWKDAP
jgi:hypothetical protein